jgi:hypothetical protein
MDERRFSARDFGSHRTAGQLVRQVFILAGVSTHIDIPHPDAPHVGTILWLLAVAGAHFVTTYQGAEYKCIVDGPGSPRAYPLEASPVSADFAWWPIGRECEWPTATGETVVVYTDNWTGTVIVYGIGAVAALGGLVALAPARRRDNADRLKSS